MDDNSAILELITEFLVSKNLLHTAQTLQHEWAGLYPGHSFPYLNNIMENASTAIPVEPVPSSNPYFFQSHHNQNAPRGGAASGDMDDEEELATDEPMNDEEDEGDEGDEGEEGEIEEEGETNAAERGAGEGEAEDSASVDSAYDRVLVEDISEIMNEIVVDEEDMGEIDPLANEASPSEESESEMEEGDIEPEDEVDYEEEGEEGEADAEEPEDEVEDEEKGEEEEDEEEGEGRELGETGEKPAPSPTRGVIESVTELLGQHIQNQRDEFYQEEESKPEADKDPSTELAKLHLGDASQQQVPSIVLNSPKQPTSDEKRINLTPLDTEQQSELTSFECDVTIINHEDKKSGGMFSPLISPTPHSPTPVLSPPVIPSVRGPGGDVTSGTTTPPASVTHSRSALLNRNLSSPLGKKHVQITSDSAPVSRSSSNTSARHGSPPPSSPTITRMRSTPANSTSSLTLSGSDIPPPSHSSPILTSTYKQSSNTPSTPPPPYSIDPADPPSAPLSPAPVPTPNGVTKTATSLHESTSSGTEPVTKSDRRNSLDHGRDVVMRDIVSPRSVDEFAYPVHVDNTTYDCFHLKIVHVKNRTGFESTKDFPIKPNTLVAGRYQIMEFLDSAAFSKAIRALDLHTGGEVCMKIIKNNKDYVDQSLDEIKLLKYLNSMGDPHKYNILQLYDFFYYKEHLFIVTELLRENLYEFYKFINENSHPPYFTIPRLQRIAKQCLLALEFIHGLDIIHTDLKPENILIKSYSRCEVKIIDFGSSCFTRDHLGSYVQSRDYRAVEVILGLPYSAKIDIWSLGCILAELFSGKVLFVNRSLATLLARVSSLVGPIPQEMISKGRFSHKFFTKYHSLLYERDEKSGQYYFLKPKRIHLKDWLKADDQDFVDFIETLLSLHPDDRPTATAALQHKWLQKVYPPI